MSLEILLVLSFGLLILRGSELMLFVLSGA